MTLVRNSTRTTRIDPTRTTLIRNRWISELRKRIRRIRQRLKWFLVENDTLGLMPRRPGLVLHAREYAFLTDPQKIEAFNRWFEEQVEEGILAPMEEEIPGRPWTAKYVESAYKRGALNAYLAARREELFEPEPAWVNWVTAFMLAPEAVSKVRLLATRSYESLRGVSREMASRMNFILARGMAEGRHPLDIAREMTEQIDNLTFRRAFVIARTETIYAHAEGQLDAFEKLGVKELGVMAEWSTAGDEQVCPLCQAQEGKKFPIDEAHGLIPFHPNCRCTWIPYIPGT